MVNSNFCIVDAISNYMIPYKKCLVWNDTHIILILCLGIHSVGQASCRNFRTRIYNETNIDSSYATSLKSVCPSTGGDNNLAPLDVTTPTTFDNNYYTNLINKKGLLHSDQQLFSGGSTDSIVTSYSNNVGNLITDFANAMVKMGRLSPLTGTSGQIRKNCRKANWVIKALEYAVLVSIFIALSLFCGWKNKGINARLN